RVRADVRSMCLLVRYVSAYGPTQQVSAIMEPSSAIEEATRKSWEGCGRTRLLRPCQLGVFRGELLQTARGLGATRDSFHTLEPSPLGYAGHQHKPLQFQAFQLHRSFCDPSRPQRRAVLPIDVLEHCAKRRNLGSVLHGAGPSVAPHAG